MPLGGDKVLRVHLVTGRPIKRPSLSALERIRLNLDPGLKPHFPCSLDVYSQPVTTHHFQATSVLLVAVTEWHASTLFHPRCFYGSWRTRLKYISECKEAYHRRDAAWPWRRGWSQRRWCCLQGPLGKSWGPKALIWHLLLFQEAHGGLIWYPFHFSHPLRIAALSSESRESKYKPSSWSQGNCLNNQGMTDLWGIRDFFLISYIAEALSLQHTKHFNRHCCAQMPTGRKGVTCTLSVLGSRPQWGVVRLNLWQIRWTFPVGESFMLIEQK